MEKTRKRRLGKRKGGWRKDNTVRRKKVKGDRRVAESSDVGENLQQGGHRQILVRQKFKPDRCTEACLPKKTYAYASIKKETF